MTDPAAPTPTLPVPAPGGFRIPLWVQIVIALALGIAVGGFFRTEPIVGTFGVDDLGRLGMLPIRALKMLAVPLVALVILDALLRFNIEGRQGFRLLGICLMNVSVALVIGLVLVNVLQPGRFLTDLFAHTLVVETSELSPAARQVVEKAPVLDPMAAFESMIPKSIAGPFANNEILGAALLAILFGAALRRVRTNGDAKTASTVDSIGDYVRTLSEALQQALFWVILTIPFAAFALVASAVGKAGILALAGLWAFLAVILLGMILHALLYYPFIVWVRGGIAPQRFLRGAWDPLITGLATNSSLATLPVTLRALTGRIGISHEAARLGAGVGTNFNNDGITLYEAMAVLIIAQACGYDLGLAAQTAVVGASLMAGAGIAGIPEAGLVMLPTVLAASGLPEAAVAAAVPLVVPVDWILARCRTAVNVLADMTVSILLDREPLRIPVPRVDGVAGEP